MKVLTVDQIKSKLSSFDLVTHIEAGFVAYSNGKAVVPPVGELLLDRGEVHIKYGYLEGDEYYVIKIASGFYDNPKAGLPSGNGMMLLYHQKTGELLSILLDEGHLTDMRTAVAGAIAAKHLAPERIERVGIVGTGVQARLQLQNLAAVTPCRQALVWGRGDKQLERFRGEPDLREFEIETTRSADDILPACNLIVTTTPATSPLLQAAGLRPGTHITAVGSDTPHKRELDSVILRRADIVVADSIEQCFQRGEIYQAMQSAEITGLDVVELGNVISRKSPGRTSDTQVTVADLTGVAVQDIKIATAVYDALKDE